jgi:hypothetical protein
MSRIDAYLDAMVEALDAIGDAPSSPVHIADVAPFFMDVEAFDLLERLRRLDAEGVTDRQLAELFPSANAIKTLLMDLVCGLKVANVAAAERVRFTERMFDAMQAVEFGDIFCRDGTHRVWPAEQAQHYAETALWSPVDTAAGTELARAAFRASASGQALVWALYFYAWTDMGWEVHGPYDITLPTGQHRRLLVRDYFDIAPSLLWPEVEQWPAATMRLSTLHAPDADIRFDVLNHVHHDQPWLTSTHAVEVRFDGTVAADVAAVRATSQRLVELARWLQRRINTWDRTVLVRRFTDSRYYAFRHWRTRFGDDWTTPAEVVARIERDPYAAPEAVTDDLALLRLAFDPRSDVLN